MILYSDNKNKFVLLFVLVVVFSGAIIWQWLRFAPWQQDLGESDIHLQQVVEETQMAAQDIKDSLGVAREQVVDIQVELAKEQQRQELLKMAGQYLEDKKN